MVHRCCRAGPLGISLDVLRNSILYFGRYGDVQAVSQVVGNVHVASGVPLSVIVSRVPISMQRYLSAVHDAPQVHCLRAKKQAYGRQCIVLLNTVYATCEKLC